MRVIAGKYKGRVLKTVKDLSVRPVTDRVKQTVFDIVTHRLDLEGASILDLFAGSGGLGIEALSRGARKATFVEANAEAIAYLEGNLRMLGSDVEAEVFEMDAMHFIGRSKSSYDLIFADPPYRFEETMSIPDLVFAGAMVKPHGYLLIEHSPDVSFASTERFSIGPVKKFGRTLVTFFHAV